MREHALAFGRDRSLVGVLTENGHNSWTRDRRYMITDTYNDAAGFRHLLLYDGFENTLTKLGSFYSPYNDTGYRCDLHPRFDRKERYVTIDSAHKIGWRQIYVVDLGSIMDR